MFTGIITHIGTIESAEQKGDLRVKIACDFRADALAAGESVAVSGVCLTVVSKGLLASGKHYFTADLSEETLRCTAPRWQKDAKVNLERALTLGDALSGHLVSGHIDGTATLLGVTESGDSHVMELEAPAGLARFIAAKGSVALDGVSLTVNRVDGNRFSVNVIPHTWSVTTLAFRTPGEALNLEVDMVARYVARLAEYR